jgi:hypothetical protein
MINWNPIQDRHVEGRVPQGSVWIRLDRENKPISWYTIFNGVTNKWMAEEEDSIELIKDILEEEYNRFLTAVEISGS